MGAIRDCGIAGKQGRGLQVGILLLCLMVSLACNLGKGIAPEAAQAPIIAPPGDVEASQPLASQAPGALLPVPSATLTSTSLWENGEGTQEMPVFTGPQKVSHYFSEEDCGCVSFPARVEASYGPGYLECSYRWAGKYIDDNSISFTIQQYDDPLERESVYREHVGWSYDEANSDENLILSGSYPNHQRVEMTNDESGFTYITTGPGGGSSKVEGEIPMCGRGSGVLRVAEDILVELHLFACDLGEERPVYVEAMQNLEFCALDNAAQAVPETP